MLLADETVAHWKINEESCVLYFLNTAGCSMWESSQKKTENPFVQLNQSKLNLGEVDLVHLMFHQIKDQGVKDEDIGIITPYNAQVNALKNKFENSNENMDKIEINTVDGFQGREKMVIIICMVRSNKEKEIGFLNDYRRMNVAITRAQKLVCLIGDGDTVQSDKFLHDLVDYFIEFGEVHSAMEFYGDSDIRFGFGENSTKDKPIKIKKERKKKQKLTKETIEIKQQKIQEKEEMISQFEAKIQKFLNSQQKELKFEGLNAFERLTIHELAEKYSLKHQSIGEGQIKNIILSKINSQESKQKKELKEIQIQNEIENLIKPINITEKICVVEVEQLENLIEPINIAEKICVVKTEQHVIPKKIKKINSKNKKKEDDLDDNAYLDALIAQNEVCNFGRKANSDNLVNLDEQPKCTAKVKLLGQTCLFCHLRYCLKHSMPELHGCEDSAQRAAKLKVIEIAEQKQRKENEVKADYLKKKLQKKINQKIEDRKIKKSKKENKK